AMMIPPAQPKEKREMVIWRNPNLGPKVEKKATGKVPNTLKMMMIARLSQKPRPKMALANVPRATVEITRLAESHMVKLSKTRTCARVAGETRSIPCVSMPFSSWGIETVSDAMEDDSFHSRMHTHHKGTLDSLRRHIETGKKNGNRFPLSDGKGG